MLSKLVLLIILSTAYVVIVQSLEYSSNRRLPRWPLDGNCKAGILYRKRCNICQCIIDGFAICSEVACDSQTLRYIVGSDALPSWPGIKQCTTGRLYRRWCNTCVCFRKGFGVCSNVNCRPLKQLKSLHISWKIPFPAPELPLDNTCAPRTYWKRCKTCSCKKGNDPYCNIMECQDHIGFNYEA